MDHANHVLISQCHLKIKNLALDHNVFQDTKFFKMVPVLSVTTIHICLKMANNVYKYSARMGIRFWKVETVKNANLIQFNLLII